jgi:hypothetical protein
MDDGSTSPLERAFQLARSGRFSTVDEVKEQLKREGYLNNQVSGPQLMQQLRALIATARGR